MHNRLVVSKLDTQSSVSQSREQDLEIRPLLCVSFPLLRLYLLYFLSGFVRENFNKFSKFRTVARTPWTLKNCKISKRALISKIKIKVALVDIKKRIFFNIRKNYRLNLPDFWERKKVSFYLYFKITWKHLWERNECRILRLEALK